MADDAVRAEIALAQVAMQRALDLLPDREHALAEANFRTEAVQIVLSALLASNGWRGLNRRRFRDLVAQASRTVPDTGPAAVQHHVLLAEATKVLETRDTRV